MLSKGQFSFGFCRCDLIRNILFSYLPPLRYSEVWNLDNLKFHSIESLCVYTDRGSKWLFLSWNYIFYACLWVLWLLINFPTHYFSNSRKPSLSLYCWKEYCSCIIGRMTLQGTLRNIKTSLSVKAEVPATPQWPTSTNFSVSARAHWEWKQKY